MPRVTQGQWKAFGLVGGLGFEFAAYLLIFVKAGAWLDARYQTTPILERVGVFMGLFACGYALWKVARKQRRASQETSSTPPSDRDSPPSP